MDLLKKNDGTLDKLHGEEVYVFFIKRNKNAFRYFFICLDSVRCRWWITPSHRNTLTPSYRAELSKGYTCGMV